MKKMLFFWRELKGTFWFIPVLIILISMFLAILLLYVDGFVSISKEGINRFFFVNSADSARSILSTISGAMIGVAGTVFSVTLVALTLASSQFGPRLVRNFMYIRLNQIVLGSYVSAYLYSLIILNAIKENSDTTYIPSLSILFAIITAIFNIILLILFIHQIATSMQADKIVADISSFISSQVRTLFPEKLENSEDSETNFNTGEIKSKYDTVIPLKCPQNGYLQYIDIDSLKKKVADFDALFELQYRPGDYLVENLTLGYLHTKNKPQQEELEKLMESFVFGQIKTAQQDLEFSIHQMVEMAVRALSPGINDPYTAIACVNNLASTLCYLAQAKFPSKFLTDEKNELRVISKTLDFEGIMDTSFNQIRQYAKGSTAVTIRLLEALITIDDFAQKEAYKQAIRKHAQMTLNSGKAFINEKNDLEDLEERAGKILKN